MDYKSLLNKLFKKLATLFAMGPVLLTIYAAPLSSTAQDKALPAAGTVVGLVRGRFDKVTGTINVSPDLAACSVDIAIDVASISTQVSERDEDLRSPAYFDVKTFPSMTYRGRGIRHVSGNSWVMDGTLTIHGVTKVVPLTFKCNGLFPDSKPGEPARAAFHAFASTKRAEYGIGARYNLEELGSLTTPDVEIEIDVEADSMASKHK